MKFRYVAWSFSLLILILLKFGVRQKIYFTNILCSTLLSPWSLLYFPLSIAEMIHNETFKGNWKEFFVLMVLAVSLNPTFCQDFYLAVTSASSGFWHNLRGKRIWKNSRQTFYQKESCKNQWKQKALNIIYLLNVYKFDGVFSMVKIL